MVFLIRIGLAIVTCCHRTLLGLHQESEALSILTRPPPFLISSSPETLIELANSFRIKDDNIRKQRVKLEAQFKLRTQSRLSGAAKKSSRNSNGDSGTTAAISLPTRTWWLPFFVLSYFLFCIYIFGSISGFLGSWFRHRVYVMYILTASHPFLACHLSRPLLLYTHALTFRYSIFFPLVFPPYIYRTPWPQQLSVF